MKLYYIDDDYIDYLRKYDSMVAFNKNASRPYVGVVYTYNDNNYFAPLSSPKPKHTKISNYAVDVWKIDNGKHGVININNMIPCPIEVLTEILPTVTDENYKNLLLIQISYININRKSLFTKINNFINAYHKKNLSYNVLKRCCDFPLLEEKCKEYTYKHLQ